MKRLELPYVLTGLCFLYEKWSFPPTLWKGEKKERERERKNQWSNKSIARHVPLSPYLISLLCIFIPPIRAVLSLADF